jgi:hypothetical protein
MYRFGRVGGLVGEIRIWNVGLKVKSFRRVLGFGFAV